MGIRYWFPKPIWRGSSAYIIGGGPSLKGFPWKKLAGEFVLGCNVAFQFGVDLVPITIFGDGSFLKRHKTNLERYAGSGGWVVSSSARTEKPQAPWLKVLKKQLRGLGTDRVGWNGNTGAAAINFALLLGADPIYLLGYDMKISNQGEGNFHNAYNHTPKQSTYNRFLRGMECVARDLPVVFPGKRVINLEDETSALTAFPKESLKEHFARELVHG